MRKKMALGEMAPGIGRRAGRWILAAALVSMSFGISMSMGPVAWSRVQRLPAPPRPPEAAPGPELAPVPNPDVQPPVDLDALTRPSFSITDFRSTTIDNSAGFGTGSQYRSSEDQRAIQTPGLAVKVPLQ
jgi:hypothetical protein